MDAILDARLGKNRWNLMGVDKKMGEVLGKGACVGSVKWLLERPGRGLCGLWEVAVEMAWKGLVWVL